MKNGSKLLLSLLAQGAVIGSVLAYKKIRGDKKSDFNSDLDSAIDEVQQKDNQKAAKNEKATDKIDDLLGDIEKGAKKVNNIIDSSTNLIDLIADFVMPEKTAKPEAKQETVQPQKTATQEAKKETVQPQKPTTQEAKKETVQPQKPATPVAKKETVQPQKPVEKVKTAEELNNNLLSQISGYTKKPKADPVVTKNKVNLPTPQKASKAEELNDRIEAAIKDKNVLSSKEVGEKVKESLNEKANAIQEQAKKAKEDKEPKVSNKKPNAKSVAPKKTTPKKTSNKKAVDSK